MTPASAKAKGRKFQQWVRDRLISLLSPFGIVAEDVKSTSMGAGGEDVQLSPLARNFLPISIECKSHKSMAVYKLYDQAKANAGEYRPVLFIKANNREPLVVIDADEYLSLEYARIQYSEGS